MPRGLVVDALVVGILVFALVRGWLHGSLRESFGLVGLLGGIAVAPALAGPLGSLIGAFSDMSVNLARLIGLIVVIAVVEIAVIALARRKAGDAEVGGPRWLDRAGGVVLAAFRGITVAVLVLYSLLGLSATNPTLPGFSQGVTESLSGDLFADASSPVVAFYDGMIARTDDMRALTLSVRQQTRFRLAQREDRVRFAPAEGDLAPMHDAEQKLLVLMNRERERAGLEPLEWCGRCARVARLHSKDMYEDGYFSHVDADGIDPFERLQNAGVAYDAAGENLAIAPSAEEAHQGLMASADHRENILRSQFDQVGIGIYRGPYGLMCTQVFRESP